MKKSDFKLMIRKIVREEVAMAIQEVITELKQPTQQVSQPKPKKKMVEKKSYTSNSILNDVLNETANDEWQTMGNGTYTSNKMNDVLRGQYGDMMSGGNVNVKEGTKKKTDTQTQTEDVFEGSGVEPMYQSASLASNDKFIKRIMDDEGEPFLEATKAFEDEKNFTIGYGRNNPNIKKGDKITLEQAQKNLAEDVEIRLEEIQDLIPNFSRFSIKLL